MIDITYEPGRWQVVVKGHAGAGKKGGDIVCAAASMLACTLSANVESLRQQGAVRRAEICLAEGAARIKACPACGCRNQVRTVFETVCRGFRLLAQMQPNHVQYKER